MDVAALRRRAALLRAIRGHLDTQGFVEVEVPVLVTGPALEATLEAVPAGDGFLHTSPEFALKRTLAAGLPRIYAMGPCFRAEERGPHHATEFTMLEFYASNAGYLDLIPLASGLVAAAAEALGVPAPTWRVQRVAELFADTIPADDAIFFRTWVERIDPALDKPSFIIDYPARHAALAEVRGEVAERVEFYLGGLEVGNGFSELRDAAELRARFASSAADRLAAGRTPHPVDEGVIAATARLPRCAGMAIGVDRLYMALTGARDIRETRLT